MIFNVNFEELQALQFGAGAFLGETEDQGVAVAAPPEERALVEALVSLLEGDLSIDTLHEQQEIEVAVRAILAKLHAEMDVNILAMHPADENAVAAYFDYAHCRAVLGRLEDMGNHMRALIELVTGEAPGADVARTFAFPD